MIIQNFDLNLIPDSAPVVVHCDQYDHGTGRLVISLYEGSVPYSPSGTAVIQGVKPDGRGFDYSCTLNGNVVTADLTEQMSAVAGQVRTQIVVTEYTGRTGTFVFILDVQKSALPDDTDMSESDYQYIEQAIETAEQAVEDAQSSAEDSEAWAVGERGGVPVGPSDPTYNNNAEYWAYIASQYAQGGLTYKGSCLFANIPVSGMNHGDMWNIEDDFTTDSRFEEGAGIACAAGTNIAWNSSKWDVLAVAKSGVQSFNGRTGIVTPQAGDYDLDDLGDIVVTSATDGQVLTWDATSQKWVNRNASGGSTSLAGLDDVSLSSPTNGQVLKYNSTSQEWENASGGGGLLPHFYIESESGSTVTVVAPDSTVITPTQVSSGHWECDVPSYGVYIVHSVLNGDDATVSVTVDDVKEYQINDAHYSFTLSVYAPVNSTVRVSASGESYYATGMGTTPVVFALHKASTAYSILVTLDGFSKSTQITTPAASGGSQSVTIEFGTINVTYENAFRGVSITCVQAAMTITKTAPSAGNTMTFYPPLTGQWTISGTVGGVPYPTTANVTSLSTPVSVNLETIPDGSTATPTDDIQKWLACAGIKDKAYTTLTQVLGDSETYNALLGDSNACAYMKRSTTWSTDICASQYAMNLLGQYDTACDALLSDATWTTALNNSPYWYGHTDSGVLIHGANGESAYILDGGSPVTITDPSTLDAGTYTVYSTVAKNPSDLTADYSKTIRICPNTKEIVVRPDNTLYWWGYNGGIQNMSSSDGWSIGDGWLTPTWNNTSITLNSASSKNGGVASINQITTKTIAYIGKFTSTSDSDRVGVRLLTSKSRTDYNTNCAIHCTVPDSVVEYDSATVVSDTAGWLTAMAGWGSGSKMELYALLHE